MIALSFHALALSCLLSAFQVQRAFAFSMQRLLVSELPLNDDGYQEVAARKSDDDMKFFIRRVLAKLGREVADEGHLSGFTRYFSGTEDVQDYDRLEAELRDASWTRRPVIDQSGGHEENPAPKPAAAPHFEVHSMQAGKYRSPPQAKTGSPKFAAAAAATPMETEALRRIPSVPLAEASSRQHKESAQAALHASAGRGHHPFQHSPAAKSVAKGRVARGSLHAAEAPLHSKTARLQSDGAASSRSSKAHRGRKHRRGIIVKRSQGNARVRSGRKHNRHAAKTELHPKARALHAGRSDAGAARNVSLLTQAHGGHSKRRLSLLGFDSHVETGAQETAGDAIRPAGKVLPAVGEVLSSASQTLKDISADTNHIRAQVKEREKALKEKMVQAKRRFETKLKDYQQQHANLTEANKVLRSGISAANKTNAVLVADAIDTQHSIHILQDTLFSLQGRIHYAEGFIDDSLNTTDVSNTTVAEVIAPTTAAPTLDTYLLRARKDLGLNSSKAPAPQGAADVDEPVGLLQVGADHLAVNLATSEEDTTPTAEKMTSVLSGTLEHLEQVEVKAYRSLKATYQSSKEKWIGRINSLLVENAELQKQLDAANQRKADLKTANQVLEGTNELLVRKLGDFTLFLAHVDDAAKQTVEQVKGKV